MPDLACRGLLGGTVDEFTVPEIIEKPQARQLGLVVYVLKKFPKMAPSYLKVHFWKLYVILPFVSLGRT